MHNKLHHAMLAVAVLLGVQAALADAPANYYKSLDGLSGQALKNAVYNLVAPHTVVTYSSLWRYFRSTDHMPDNTERVYDMYSDYAYYFNGNSAVSGMNKEHSFPKSWWGGSTTVDAYTDLNHLYPSDSPANLAKSNWPLGEVSTVTFENGVTTVGTPKSGQGGGAGTVFEPDDRYKGDFARTYFYMACCYQNLTWKYTYQVNNTSWKTLNDWSVAMLMRWHRADPVSDKETDRNDAVYRVQNNRNPFIDYPELAEYIWGNKQGQVFNLDGGGSEPGDTTVTGPTLITPTQGTELDFGTVALGSEIKYTVWVKGANLTNSLSVQLYRWDYKMFQVSESSIPRSQANSAEGYPLVITYRPTEVGDHRAKLLISDGGLTGSVGIELYASCIEGIVPHVVMPREPELFDMDSYVAHWEPADATISSYLVTRNIYEGGSLVQGDEIVVDPNQTSYEFHDLKPGQTHTYSVQAQHLGLLSPEGHAITVTPSSVNGVAADKPLVLLPIDGGVVAKCSEPIADVRVFTPSGVMIDQIATLYPDEPIYLPAGIYLVTTGDSHSTIKIVVQQ